MTSLTHGLPRTASRHGGRTMTALKACGYASRRSRRTGVDRLTSPSRSSRITKMRLGALSMDVPFMVYRVPCTGPPYTVNRTPYTYGYTVHRTRSASSSRQHLLGHSKHLVGGDEAHTLVVVPAQRLLARGAEEPAADHAVIVTRRPVLALIRCPAHRQDAGTRGPRHLQAAAVLRDHQCRASHEGRQLRQTGQPDEVVGAVPHALDHGVHDRRVRRLAGERDLDLELLNQAVGHRGIAVRIPLPRLVAPAGRHDDQRAGRIDAPPSQLPVELGFDLRRNPQRRVPPGLVTAEGLAGVLPRAAEHGSQLTLHTPEMPVLHGPHVARYRPKIPQRAPRPPQQRQNRLAQIDEHIGPVPPDKPCHPHAPNALPEGAEIHDVPDPAVVGVDDLGAFADHHRQLRIWKPLVLRLPHGARPRGLADIGVSDQ